ncbi:MAG: DNRLRE domain-containing protein [Desulfobulbaceae bacterium]|nr:DNRLRE domain-containing protein [Desulfobulbaceae bacterium]
MSTFMCKSFLLLLLFSMFAASKAEKAIAATYKLKPTDDSYADQLSPGNNYSDLNYLISRNSIAAAYTYLKFSLSDIPSDEQITGAVLGLYSQYGYRSWVTLSHISDDSWIESEVTWNNRPENNTQTFELDRQYLDLPYNWILWDLFAEEMWNPDIDKDDGYISLMTQTTGSDLIFASSIFFVSEQQPYLLLITEPEQDQTTNATPTPIPSSFVLLGISLLTLMKKNRKSSNL